ncbi:DALR anticodon-binding domain-containing protein [Sinosporangium siamense]|uniref:DALR anticodon binding domain-containing protein n=1 Tax=Sinosporangium siamense TaxID=1367973 RepID=A0A919RF32_9ACTN|nr:DALR anticodon-binding domain-containing protein [Sinosporangium siamense]GII91244.1 hypothetical protein Ssi02_14750 [Sinosporangium siamense]
MTPGQLSEVLGEPPEPRGAWVDEAVYVSAVAFKAGGRAREVGEGLAARLRGLRGVGEVRVRGAGFVEIVVTVPGEVVREIVAGGPQGGKSEVCRRQWSDLPRTWENPGFVVRYAYFRACAVQRWAHDLGVRREPFRAEELVDRRDRAVVRALAEVAGRRVSREPGWAAYLERLAMVYHDAHEGASAVPQGDETGTELHTARLWLAEAVRVVLEEGLSRLGEPLPGRM